MIVLSLTFLFVCVIVVVERIRARRNTKEMKDHAARNGAIARGNRP